MTKKSLLLPLVFLLFQASPLLARDKDQIDLTCGDTKATITCTKFEDNESGKGVCVASTLAFDTENGKHVVASYKPPQHFTVPTIFEAFNCITTSKKSLFSLWSTPNCEYAQCVTQDLFDKNGIHVAGNNKKRAQAIGTSDENDVKFSPQITLRGNDQ